MPWTRKRYHEGIVSTSGSSGFPRGSDGKESACNVGDLGLISGLARSPGGGHGNALQYSYLEDSHRQKSLASYGPWGCLELDTIEQLITVAYYHDLLIFGDLRESVALQNLQMLHMDFCFYYSVSLSCFYCCIWADPKSYILNIIFPGSPLRFSL